jgi:hypothetical protein
MVLTLAAPLSPYGPDVAVLVQLPILLSVAGLVFAIVRQALPRDRRTAVWAATLTTLSAPVLDWSLMLHMALASAAADLLVIYAYIHSEGLEKPAWSALTGAALGLLLLSRSMAPVYASMTILTLLVSLTVFHGLRLRWKAVGLALVGSVAIAGPWYAVSGRAAFEYLTSVGYSSHSGFLENSNPVLLRIHTTWSELGWALTAFIVVALFAAVTAPPRREMDATSSRTFAETRFVLFLNAALIFSFLSTSRSEGTAFDLPAVVSVLPAVVMSLPQTGLAASAAGLAGAFACAAAISQVWLLPGWERRSIFAPAPLYAEGVRKAVGTALPRSRELVLEFANRTRGSGVFVARDDAVINVNALIFERTGRVSEHHVGAPPFDPTVVTADVPAEYEFAITGDSCAPYHRNIDQALLEKSLADSGWAPVMTKRLSACNRIVLWKRGSTQ